MKHLIYICTAILLLGCASDENDPDSPTTDSEAPVKEEIDIVPGSIEDYFMKLPDEAFSLVSESGSLSQEERMELLVNGSIEGASIAQSDQDKQYMLLYGATADNFAELKVVDVGESKGLFLFQVLGAEFGDHVL